MNNEFSKWCELFNTIITENTYYENIRFSIKEDKNFALGNLVDDYIDNANFISVYYYLDSIEDWLAEHKNKTVFNALEDLWNTGNWKE